ncbi:MAG: discoidin domain-containing protein [Actinomycetota bacterium]
MRDRLSRLSGPARDDGRTVLEAVVALSIIAATAAAWSQLATTAAHAERSGDQRNVAVEIAASEIEILRVTPGIEDGADSDGGLVDYEGLTILADASGPSQSEDVDVDGTTYTIDRYVLDPGSTSWRRIVVEVRWNDRGIDNDIRVDTAIPIIPEPSTIGADLLVNGSFEFPNGGGPAPGTWGIYTVEGWTSDRSDGRIEVWPTGFSSTPASDGDFLLELNVSVPRTLSQTVNVTPGAVYEWAIDHRGRSNDDTMEVLVDGAVVATHTTPRGAWVTYSGTYQATGNTLTLGFRAVDSGGVGNLIDNARLSLVGTNVALGATATQASIYANDLARYGPANAVDGLTGGNWPGDDISITTTYGSWWEVDLGAEHSIRQIRIHNRTDCCGDRLGAAGVMIGSSSFGNDSLADASSAATWSTTLSASPGAYVELDVPSSVGRYVRIQLPPTGTPYLQLAEVEVIGVEVVAD